MRLVFKKTIRKGLALQKIKNLSGGNHRNNTKTQIDTIASLTMVMEGKNS